MQANKYHYNNAILNIFWALYILLLSETLLIYTRKHILENTGIVYLFPALLIVAMLAETYALPRKLRYVFASGKAPGNEANNTDNEGCLQFGLWMFHTLISTVITMFALQMLGFDIKEAGNELFITLVLFAVIIKELVLLFFIMGLTDNENTAPPPRYTANEWFCDVVLLIYACLAYTVTWQTITYNMRGAPQENTAMLLVNMAASALLFLLFYLPLRIPYLIEETRQITDNRQAGWFALSMLQLVAAMWYEMFA